MDLKGAVAIVTGSAAGIGAATAELLAEKGARVVINYSKSKDEAEAVAKTCEATGAEVLVAQADVANDDDCRRMVQETIDKWGHVDILVNNAGTTQFADHADLDALQADDFQRIYSVNVVGAYQMIRACTPHMKAKGAGYVVNMSSIAGVTGIGSCSAYAASKGALNTLTLSLARALGPEIRVNAICPGFVGTRWFRDHFGEETFNTIVDRQKETTPLKRAGTPEDIARAVMTFCGEGADHLTGQMLVVDAGLHLGYAPTVAR